MSKLSKEHLLNDQSIETIEKLGHKIRLSNQQSGVLFRLCQDLGDIVPYEDEALAQVSLEYLRVIVYELNKTFRREGIPISIQNCSGIGYCLRLRLLKIVPTAITGHDTPPQRTSEQSQDCPLTESDPLVDTRTLKSPAGANEIESEVLQWEEDEVLSRTTEVKCRHGQDRFREKLMNYWEGRCPLTGISDGDLLRASHIIPWTRCETDTQRLDQYNGILLSGLWDLAFDKGLVTFDEDGWPLFSGSLSDTDQAHLQLGWLNKPIPLEGKHQAYLDWHRERIFRKPRK